MTICWRRVAPAVARKLLTLEARAEKQKAREAPLRKANGADTKGDQTRQLRRLEGSFGRM
jgi:hypothetical protein